MRCTHESLGTLRGIVAMIIVVVLIPCGDLVVTLQAATPPEQSTDRSSGSQNPHEARRTAMQLGVGRYVAVKLSSGETVRGYILDIADDHFALLLDGMAAPADVAYGDVRRLRPIPQPVPRSRAALRGKTGMIIAVAYFGFMWVCSSRC